MARDGTEHAGPQEAQQPVFVPVDMQEEMQRTSAAKAGLGWVADDVAPKGATRR